MGSKVRLCRITWKISIIISDIGSTYVLRKRNGGGLLSRANYKELLCTFKMEYNTILKLQNLITYLKLCNV